MYLLAVNNPDDVAGFGNSRIDHFCCISENSSLGVSHWSFGGVLHLLLSTSSADLRPCGFLVLLRSVVQKHSPLAWFGLELPVFPSLCSLSRKHRGAQSALSGSERIDALRYQRVKKAKKMTMNNNNSKTRKKAGVSSTFYTVIYANACHIMMTTGKTLLSLVSCRCIIYGVIFICSVNKIKSLHFCPCTSLLSNSSYVDCGYKSATAQLFQPPFFSLPPVCNYCAVALSLHLGLRRAQDSCDWFKKSKCFFLWNGNWCIHPVSSQLCVSAVEMSLTMTN